MTELLSDEQLLRYSRHILLPQVDVDGQQAICNSRVLVVGAGGLGSPVVLYLAAAGVGTLVIADGDEVELTNLQRQVAHTMQSLGQSKVESAQAAAAAINPQVQCETLCAYLDEQSALEPVKAADVVIDCSDNFATRQLLNRLCLEFKKPLVSGAAIRLEGQLTLFDFRQPESPCYQCLYDIAGEQALSCSESGVLGPVVGVIGAAQALEALKVIAGFGEPLVGRLQLFDALSFQWREFKLRRDAHCSVCGKP